MEKNKARAEIISDYEDIRLKSLFNNENIPENNGLKTKSRLNIEPSQSLDGGRAHRNNGQCFQPITSRNMIQL